MDNKDGKKKEDGLIFPQSNILGINPNASELIITGDQILGMKVTSLEETKNFLFGVNNFASQFSQNSILLDSIAKAEDSLLRITPEVNRLNSVFSENVVGVKLFTENMTTVMAYGKAVQDQFSILTENPLFKDSIATLEKTKTHLDSILERSTIYTPPKSIASPFLFTPKEIITEEVIEKLPEIKKNLPAKTTKAIELMEYVFDTDTKNNDKIITTTVAELKRAVKNMQGSISMFVQQTTQKIEITAIPELKVKNIDENVVVKNTKRITLPKFPRTEWLKVSITFLGDRDILLSNGKDTKPSSFQGLGCEDGRNGRPDDNWSFLLKLAMDNGQTLPIAKKEREKRKKQKQKITDILRKIFDNDTDPFEKETGGVYKTKFNIKYNNEEKTINNKYSDIQETFSEMTEL